MLPRLHPSSLCIPGTSGTSDQGLAPLPPLWKQKGVPLGQGLAAVPAPHPGPGTQEVLSEYLGDK